MKINYKSIKDKESLNYECDTKLLNELNHNNFIKKINNVKGIIEFDNTSEDILIIKFDLDYSLNVLSTISLNEFEYNATLEEELYLTNNKELESEDIIYLKDGFELDEIIYSLIVTDLPITLKQEGEHYENGDNYKVLSEDEVEKERSEFNSSPFDDIKL